jgi:hypothetical protein
MRIIFAIAAVFAASTAVAQNSGAVQSTPEPSTTIPERIEQRPSPQARPEPGPLAPAVAPDAALNAGLPEACRRAAALAGHVDLPMDGGLPQPTNDAAGRMTPVQRALLQAMTRMQAGMMQGMTARDADVAWICAMIPHHQGAIAMAQAGLAGSDNPESRRLAEETIRMLREEIAKLVRWVEANGDRESRNESGQPPERQ